MESLRGKVALVTGASRGIGRAIALELSMEGAFVVINYSKDDNGAKLTLSEVIANGGSGKLLKGDISSYESSEKIIEEVINTCGKVDILVNNAGISKVGLFMDSTKDDIDAIMGTNMLGAMYLSKHVLPHMINNEGGNIINISSIWGEVGASCEVLYSATKGGLNSFTKALAKEVAPWGIRVNGVAPGVIETQMNSFLDKEDREALEEEIPMGRFGCAKEIGKAVVFLSSEGCKYLTGQVIRIDGGMI